LLRVAAPKLLALPAVALLSVSAPQGVIDSGYASVRVSLASQGGIAATPGDQVPLAAMLGDKRQFQTWSSQFRNKLVALVNATPNLSPVGNSEVNKRIVDGVRVTTLKFEYPAHSILYGRPGGGVLAVPTVIDPEKPIVVAIHGHEHSPWGDYPTALLTDGHWPYAMVKRGYIVWSPVSMYHEEILNAARSVGYIPVWTQIISEGLDYASSRQFAALPHSGYAVLGLSSGGHIAFTLMAVRPDIRAGVFAGADQELQFLRDTYRVKNHPDCWDIPAIASYTTIQALIAPRPIQFQIGQRDPFFPDGKPLAPNGASFSGTPRGVLSDEAAGHILILRSIWRLMGGPEVAYDIHAGGHELDSRAALEFLTRTIGPAINSRREAGLSMSAR
jgi:hypothetical protein